MTFGGCFQGTEWSRIYVAIPRLGANIIRLVLTIKLCGDKARNRKQLRLLVEIERILSIKMYCQGRYSKNRSFNLDELLCKFSIAILDHHSARHTKISVKPRMP